MQDALPIVIVAVVVVGGLVFRDGEVRGFVESRNARRVARGEPPLGVEAEIEPRLSGSDG